MWESEVARFQAWVTQVNYWEVTSGQAARSKCSHKVRASVKRSYLGKEQHMQDERSALKVVKLLL